MAPWRDAPPEWGTEATPARQAALRANLGHTAQNDHQPVGQDSPAGLFIARKHLAHNRIISFHPRVQPDSYLHFFTFRPVWGVFSSRTTGFYLFCPRAQPDSKLPPGGCNGISRTTGIAVHQLLCFSDETHRKRAYFARFFVEFAQRNQRVLGSGYVERVIAQKWSSSKVL